MLLSTLTALLVVVTAIYAWLTHGILKANEKTVEQMRLQAKAISRPYVTIGTFVPPGSVVLYLRIQNTGRTAAENLRLRIDRDFWLFGDVGRRNLRDCVAFAQPIGTFAPGGELIFGLAPAPALFGKDADPAVIPPRFTITASYDIGRERIRESTTVDLMPYQGASTEPDPYLNQLKELTKTAGKISRDLGELIRAAK